MNTKSLKFLNLSIFISLAFNFIPLTSSSQWIQQGGDIDGEAMNDFSGTSVSMPDNVTIAIGAPSNNGNGNSSGHVRIYRWNGNSWIQKGGDIDGENRSNLSGTSVSMPDSNTVAIGAPGNPIGQNRGHVRVYTWSGTSWMQKGVDIDGESTGDRFGTSANMYSSNTLSVGAPNNDGNGNNSGHVRVFDWNGSTWIQRGIDIDGEAGGDLSGRSVSMADSLTIAIGAYQNDGNGNNAGHVRVYKWNGNSWIQKGIDIDGEAADDRSGFAIDMPDTNIVAIGAYLNDGNGNASGHVRVYRWNGSSWAQKGLDIDGDSLEFFGEALSMPDSNTLAVGSQSYEGPNYTNPNIGRVRAFEWDGSSWIQIGGDIIGEADGDQFGADVCMPSNRIVGAGATWNDGNGSSSGHVRVFEYAQATLLPENLNENRLAVYPNPSNGNVYIESESLIGERIQIIDLSGKVVMDYRLSQSKSFIDLNDLQDGLYFLKVKNEVRKIVLQK